MIRLHQLSSVKQGFVAGSDLRDLAFLILSLFLSPRPAWPAVSSLTFWQRRSRWVRRKPLSSSSRSWMESSTCTPNKLLTLTLRYFIIRQSSIPSKSTASFSDIWLACIVHTDINYKPKLWPISILHTNAKQVLNMIYIQKLQNEELELIGVVE